MVRVRASIGVGDGGRSGARRFAAAVALVVLGGVAVPAATTPADPAVVTVDEADGTYTVAATFAVQQPPSFAHAALTDYAQIPRFMPEVQSSQVVERDNARTVVAQEVVARFMLFSKRLHLLLEIREESGTIRFRDRSGRSFARYEGAWTIAEHDGSTRLTYELTAQPLFDVPSVLLKRLLRRDAAQMIGRLTAEIDARAVFSRTGAN
jgi:ribosome-associated toxin RatA of RatAB toxin-antitoxin module